MELLGTTRISTLRKATIIQEVVKALGVDLGDSLAFYIDDGKIILKNINEVKKDI